MTRDRLQYEVFYWLWRMWHMRLRQFFDGFTPTRYGWLGSMRLPYAKYVTTSRPWWHMTCNGNCGGWRTALCDWLEGKWRSTKHYSEPDLSDIPEADEDWFKRAKLKRPEDKGCDTGERKDGS